MRFEHCRWSITELSSHWGEIHPKPQFQRGDAWNDQRRSFLIDSILSGLDIPKVYLWCNVNMDGLFKYEIADGQQRLISIQRFLENALVLRGMSSDYRHLNGKRFDQLTDTEKNRINDFEIELTVVYADLKEIQELFRRLQLGIPLNSAEIRNSMASALGNVIRLMAMTHPFFQRGPFTKDRFQADDMVAHAFATLIYKRTRNMKASDLAKMYHEFANTTDPTIEAQVFEILDFLDRMQEAVPGCITFKWGFVDLVGVLANRNLRQCDPIQMAEAYRQWEQDRKTHTPHLAELDKAPGSRERHLFDYIISCQKDGAMRKNLQTGFRILDSVLPQSSL